MDTAIVFYFLSLNGTSRVEVAEGFTHALSLSFSLEINLAPKFWFVVLLWWFCWVFFPQ